MTRVHGQVPARLDARWWIPRLFVLVLALALALALAVLGLGLQVATAQPDEDGPPEEPKEAEEAEDQLFQDLLAGQSDGDWRGALNRIWKEKDASWKGRHLGRLFGDSTLRKEHLACAAYTAAYAADHPVGESGDVLLGIEILRRAHGVDDFVGMLRSHLTTGEGGWERLLDHARGELRSSEDVPTRRAAVFFLSHEDGAGREAVRRELLEAARADRADVTGSADEAAIASEYLAAFDRMFGFRFRTIKDALERLDALAEKDLAAVILDLSRRKDGPSAPLRARVVDYGRRLVDALGTPGRPKALAEFLDPERTPFAPLRRHAIARAARLEPAATEEWKSLVERVLFRETDEEVLRGALTLLEQAPFSEVPEIAASLSTAVAARIASGGPHTGQGSDPVVDRVRMARLLGSLRVRTPAFDALIAAEDDRVPEVLAELIRARGGVPGVRTEEMLELYRGHVDGALRDQLVRVAVVDALGRVGANADGADSEAAAGALREVLTGEGEAGVGRADEPEVRQHAIRSLASHSGAETAATLLRLARGEDDGEARVAIVVLRKVATADQHAVGALTETARDPKLSADRRVHALDAFAELGGGVEVDLAPARAAAREVLASEVEDAVRQGAARAAAALADVEALAPLLAWWGGSPEPERLALVGSWMAAVARGGGEHDPRLRQALAEVGEKAGWGVAESLARALVGDHPRDVLRLALAESLFALSADDAADAALRRAQLGEADQLLAAVLGASPEASPLAALPLHVQVLERAGRLAAEPEDRRDRYLDGVRRAVLSEGRDTVELGLVMVQALREPDLAALLDEEQARQVDAWRQDLQARLRD